MRILIEVIGWFAGLLILRRVPALIDGEARRPLGALPGDEHRRCCRFHRKQRSERRAAISDAQRDLDDDRYLYVVAEACGALMAD